MEIRLETQHLALAPSTGSSLTARVRRVLSRLGDRIARLHVTLKETNGRDGPEKVCMLRAELTGGGQVVVVDRSRELRRAVMGCLQRSKSRITSELERRRQRRRQRVSIADVAEATSTSTARDRPRGSGRELRSQHGRKA